MSDESLVNKKFADGLAVKRDDLRVIYFDEATERAAKAEAELDRLRAENEQLRRDRDGALARVGEAEKERDGWRSNAETMSSALTGARTIATLALERLVAAEADEGCGPYDELVAKQQQQQQQQQRPPSRVAPPMDLRTANLHQVGGEHYRKMTIQHWDYVLANNIQYLEAQAIKYISRHRSKNGKQDLLKARHFIDKMVEAYYG